MTPGVFNLNKTQGFRVELQVSGGEGYQVRDKTGIRQVRGKTDTS